MLSLLRFQSASQGQRLPVSERLRGGLRWPPRGCENLDESLLALESRLKEGNYRARPVRRRWIAKAGSSKMRPLGIPVLEDKIVQQAVRMILEPIAQRLVYKWFNRRSQRRSYNMTAFMEAWERWEMPTPRVVGKPWPQARQALPGTI